MIKIWFMLILISMPNAPSVKYNGFIYPSEEACEEAKYALMETYNWWYGIAGSVVGTVAGVAAGAVTFGTFAVGVGVGVGALIANAGYDDKLLNIIQFTHNDADQDQVHDARKNTK